MSLTKPLHSPISEAREASRSAVAERQEQPCLGDTAFMGSSASFQVYPENEKRASVVMSLSLRERLGEGEGVKSSFKMMSPSDQPLTPALSPLPRGEGGRRSRLVSVLGLSILLAACGKTPETAKAPAPSVSPPPAVVSDAHIEAELAKAMEPTRNEVQDSLADEAESILDQYPNKNVTDLLALPEVNESLKVALTKLSQDKGLQNKINSTVELAARMKGLEGSPGSVGLDLDTQNYDAARKSRLLQAVLSEDPKRLIGFVIEEIGEATPELSYGGAERASNGVAIKENAPPAK